MEDLRTLNARTTFRRTGMAALVVALMFLVLPCAPAKTSTNKPAKVKVSGFGFIGNRETIRLLRNFQVGGKMPTVIDRTFVEDATLLLLSRANGEGFLNARIAARFKMMDGSRRDFVWTNAMETLLPPDFRAKAASFRLKRGKRFYYKELEFVGLKGISERQARGYFVSGDVLLPARRNRTFSPAGLKRSLGSLKEAYARAGYQQAVVATNSVTRKDSTGAVKAEIAVAEGLPTIVRRVKVRKDGTMSKDLPKKLTRGKPYSHWWQQTLVQTLQTERYARGYPDATVTLSVLARETNASNIEIDVLADVKSGTRVRLGKVRYRGNKRTKTSVLESRVKLKEGQPLNRVEAERSRQRLARLGVFDSVRLQYENVTNDERNVIFHFQEAKPITLSLLGGFGTYELLRGGMEFQHRNFLGLAHNIKLRGSQSFKATKGDLLYTVPEAFGENVNLFSQATILRREEESFNREEYGGSLGVQKRLVAIHTDASLRYDYEFLNALDIESTSANRTGLQEARAAAFVIDLTRDRRDHPMSPRSGTKFYTRWEFATESIGGNVDYQRFIFGASYHLDLRGGRYLHFGGMHGISFTYGGTDDELPFNKRFLPGGENSVRGYQEGNASPLDENGDQLGAETFTQGNVEFEQSLTKALSLVTFFDAVGFAKDRGDYPWDETLYSVGGGLRWRTLIGPIRLEYGYNLHRREHDPMGTLHFSIGYPF